jgi:hypothetical protein
MLKKIIVLAFVVSLFVGLNSLNTVNAESFIKTESLKIRDASYSEIDQCFYVYTVRYANGSFWAIDIKREKNETLKQFKQRVIGKTITFTYIENDWDSEIIKTTIK